MNTSMLLIAGVCAVLFTGTVLLLLQRLQQQEKLAARMETVKKAGGVKGIELRDTVAGIGVLGAVSGLGVAVTNSGLLSAKTIEETQTNLRIAGFRGRNALGLLVGAKLLMLVVLPIAFWQLLRQTGWSPPMAPAIPAVGAILGLLLPDYIVRSLRKRHLKALDRGLPDALDMLVICSEAGLGLEPGIERVGAEIRLVHPAIAEEMIHTAQEMRVNSDRRVALLNMGTRTGLDSLRRLGGTLVQTMQYGTPLSDALRVLSAEMRQEALAKFEARASRLPVLLTLPMILFILPCVFLIVGGPAMVQVIQAMTK